MIRLLLAGGLLLGLLLLYAPAGSRPTLALEDGLARTPPLGWNSWNHFGCDVSETLIRRTADAMVASGMRDAGYQYLTIDDCWQVARDGSGTIVADPQRFPSGIAALADYLHARGLKLGLYTDAGSRTCAGRPGSQGYEFHDAATYAAWGVDYLKVDWCYTSGLSASRQYALWRDALFATGRPIVLSICTWGEEGPWDWGRGTGHLWRTTRDIADRWPVVLQIIRENVVRGYAAGPGGWNDPDMLEVGNGRMSDTEYRTHFSLWAMMAAPLIAGNDLTQMSEATRTILLNREVIAIDQDALGAAALIVRDDDGPQVWSRPLADGSRAVALFNPTDHARQIAVGWSEIGLDAPTATVRDLWAHADLGTLASYSATVEPHGTLLLRVSPAAAADTPAAPDPALDPAPPADPPADAAPVSYHFLSDLPWSAAFSGYGPAERNMSNGEAGAGDGRTITLGGTSYAHGLGVHAPADLRFDLGGGCFAFAADVGIDGEVGARGAAAFQVWADDRLLYDSGTLHGAQPPTPVYLDITGARELRLVVAAAGSTDYAHASWGDARVACQG